MSLLDPRRARVINDVAYGRDTWNLATLFVSQSTDGEIELTTPLQIIKLTADQALHLPNAQNGVQIIVKSVEP